MAKVKVTQVRSIINRPNKQRATMQALGLNRINKTVELEGTPPVLGMIEKVKHLVKVEQ